MVFQKAVLLAVGMALAPLAGWAQAGVSLAPRYPWVPSYDEEKVALAPAVQDVVSLVQSGVSDDVVIAYVEGSYVYFDLTMEDILELQQQGVSEAVITAMLRRDKVILDQMQEMPPSDAEAPEDTSGGGNLNRSTIHASELHPSEFHVSSLHRSSFGPE